MIKRRRPPFLTLGPAAKAGQGGASSHRWSPDRKLTRQITLTRLALTAERAANAFWPAASFAIASLALAALGFFQSLPQSWFAALGLLALIATLGLVWHGARRFHLPSSKEAEARLDASLKGRPLATLRDAQAIGQQDPASVALWQAHLARMAQAAELARAPRPKANLRQRDPYALRLIALSLGLTALVFGSGEGLKGAASLSPQGAQALVAGPVWEGWVRPPAYTGKPAIYLNDVTAPALELPQGSRVILRFYGEAGALGVTETISDAPLSQAPSPGTAPQQEGAEFTAQKHGQLAVTGPNGRQWDIAVLPDLPPQIATVSAPQRQANGEFKLPFTARDDYGVTKATAQITLDLASVDRRYGLSLPPEQREALLLTLPLPNSRKRTELTATLRENLAKHPFANLPVIISLRAEDAAGQQGDAAPLATLLPGRRFFDPVAATVAEMRRDLLWSLDNSPRSAQILRTILHRPEYLIPNPQLIEGLRKAVLQIEEGLDDASRDVIAEVLWEIALSLEEGDLASALERLKRAQNRLDQAMKNGASQSEIDDLMQEMRKALSDYMRQLAQEGEREPPQQPQNMDGMQMSGDQIQEMLNKLQELMEQGKMAEAMELMDLLRQLMENMQVVPSEGQGEGQGQGSMRDLSETMRRQQSLSDEAFRELQDSYERELNRQRNPAQEGPEGDQPAPDGDMAQRQRDLRDQLRALGRGEMPADGSEKSEEGRRALERSGQAMEGAEQALREGDLPRALDRQSDAMEALREGMRAFNEAQAQERGQRQDPSSQSAEGEARQGGGGQRDPLGRNLGPSGQNDSGENMVPGEDQSRRADELLQELRRRSGEQQRPKAERDYFGRLLDQF